MNYLKGWDNMASKKTTLLEKAGGDTAKLFTSPEAKADQQEPQKPTEATKPAEPMESKPEPEKPQETAQEKPRKPQKNYIKFNLGQYTDYVKTMAGFRQTNVTNYIQDLIAEDMEQNSEIYEKLKNM